VPTPQQKQPAATTQRNTSPQTKTCFRNHERSLSCRICQRPSVCSVKSLPHYVQRTPLGHSAIVTAIGTRSLLSRLFFCAFLLPADERNRVTAMGRARLASSAAPRLGQQGTFKENWLSDVSTYPIMIICSSAVCGSLGFISYKFMYCPNVRVTSGCKNKIIRTWS
jgi:hypothetical protein